jgi:hypothetical protein
MKWTAAATLLAVPLALASSVQNMAFVERRHESSKNGGGQSFEVGSGSGKTTIVVEQIVVIWVNYGGGATTAQINSASTAAGAAAAATHTVSKSLLSLRHAPNTSIGYCWWSSRVGVYT